MEIKNYLIMESKRRIEIENTFQEERIKQQQLQQTKDAFDLQLTTAKTLLETTTRQHKELQTALRIEVKQAHKELDNMLVHLKSSINEETKRRIQIEKTLEDKISKQAKLHETTRRKQAELQTALKHELDVETRRRIEVEERLGGAWSDYQILHEQLQIEREEKMIVSQIDDQIFFANEHNAAQLEANRKQYKDLETTLQNKVQKAEEELADISEQLKSSLNVRIEIEKTLKNETSEQQKLQHSMAELKRQLVESETLLETTRKQHEELENTHRNELQKLDDISAKLKSTLDEETKRKIEIEKTLEEQKREHMKSHEIERKVIEERDDFIKADEWRQMIEGQSSNGVVSFKIFSLSELEKATDNFNKSRMIGEGGYSYVYKGSLRDTIVAIKISKPEISLEAIKFNQEVEILTKVRHPNLVMFIGACLKAQALVFEFIPNGSLNSYLSNGKNDKIPPWQERIRIASEICAALMFLHSIPPHGIAHGDLKPENILLDSNFVCKLTDFGISRKLQLTESTLTPLHLTANPVGTFCYFDPEYLCSGQLTPQSDIFAFGAILLQLITGTQPQGLNQIVRDALDDNKLDTIVDPSAGEWPIEEAKKLASLGLWCNDRERRKRPDLTKDVWPSIVSMKEVAGFHIIQEVSRGQTSTVPKVGSNDARTNILPFRVDELLKNKVGDREEIDKLVAEKVEQELAKRKNDIIADIMAHMRADRFKDGPGEVSFSTAPLGPADEIDAVYLDADDDVIS